jgi:predicted nucleotidyltransferase
MMHVMDTAAPPLLIGRDAGSAAEMLARSPGVLAVCLLGSSARGDDDDGSDLDFLALVEDRTAAAAIRTSFRGHRAGRRVQLRLMTEAGLMRVFERRSTFAVHVLRESVALYDPNGRFATLRGDHSLDDPVHDDGSALQLRLEGYEELSWCQGLYLYCLSDLYSIGRAAAFTILGREAKFEFSGPRALDRVAREYPDLKQSARCVTALRPFFLLVERDQKGPLPFAHRDCHREAHRARDATAALVYAIR